jgi:L-threonylcarbamoyladenylate synthase
MLRLTAATHPGAEGIATAAALIRAGKVVAIPTDTFYGLAADPLNPEAVQAIIAVKARDAGKAIPLIVADRAQVDRYFGPLPAAAAALANMFWPGPLTLVVAAPPAFPDDLTAGTRTAGIRVPAQAVARMLCAACDRPLTATSANVSGEEPTVDPDVVAASLGGRIAALLDAGETPGGRPSTIVDVTGTSVRLVRAGAIPWETIGECLRA